MRKCLIFALLIANVAVFAQSKWRCGEDGNPFDGYVKAASIESFASEPYLPTNVGQLKVEIYKNSQGDTLIAISPYARSYEIAVNGNKYNLTGDGIPSDKLIMKQPLFSVVNGEFKGKPYQKTLINDLKSSSSFQIRMGPRIADYKFTLKGSSAAIDCALK